MKRLAAFIFAIGFIFFLAISLTVMGTPVPSDKPSPTQPVNTPLPGTDLQYNIIVIHATDLGSEKPSVISVWAILFFNPMDALSDIQPALHFKQIYPSLSDNQSINNLGSSFSLDSAKNVSPDFLSQINAILPNDGYILMDAIAGQILVQRATGIPITLSNVPAATVDEVRSLLQAERTILLDVCTRLSIPEDQRGPAPDWSKLTNTHFQTNLPFDEFSAIWETMSSLSNPPACEVSAVK